VNKLIAWTYKKRAKLKLEFSQVVHTDEAFELFLCPYVKQRSPHIRFFGGNKIDASPKIPTKTKKNLGICGHLLTGVIYALT
jgi:hypothetical protein